MRISGVLCGLVQYINRLFRELPKPSQRGFSTLPEFMEML